MTLGFVMINESNFYRTREVFNKTSTGAVRRDWLLRAVLSFHNFFTFATKFLCTAGEVAQTVTFSGGQYLHFSLFPSLKPWNLIC